MNIRLNFTIINYKLKKDITFSIEKEVEVLPTKDVILIINCLQYKIEEVYYDLDNNWYDYILKYKISEDLEKDRESMIMSEWKVEDEC